MSPAEILLVQKDIDRILTRMAHEIVEIHHGTESMALIGIQTRGVHLARRLRKKIREIEDVDVPAGEMDINLYRDDWTRITHHPVVRETRIDFSVDGRQLILVDDVLFTGRTIRAAMDAVMDYGRPDRIELAVLVDRGHRELPIEGNYVGKVVETRHSQTVNVRLTETDGTDEVVLDS